MEELKKITYLHFSDFSKSLGQNFHQSVFDIFNDSGLSLEEEIKAILNQYGNDIQAMQDVVGLPVGLEITKTKKKLVAEVARQYRYLYRIWRSFAFDHLVVTESEYDKLKREILDVYPLVTLNKSVSSQFGLFTTLLAHLKSDWMPLLEKTGLTELVAEFEQTLQALDEAMIRKAEELSRREKGIAKRIMAEMAYNYHILMSYLEAWSNNWSEDEAIKARHDKALSALNQINQLIAETKHGLAVAKSNRRRAKKKTAEI